MRSTVNDPQPLASAPRFEATAFEAEPAGSLVEAAPEGARRWLNVGVAVALLLLALPVMIVLVVLIKLTSPGPVLYTQSRIGMNTRLPGQIPIRYGRRRTCDLGGRPFLIFKFRTMRVDAERRSGAVWATQNDPRVTWIGRLLRRTRLDELPQLFNVLNGDMNVVGPRPERPAIFARLADEVEQYPLRQRVRPGITGLAQISQQYDRSVDDVRRKLEYDLQYIETQGVGTDLLIMIKTIPVLMFRKGGW